MLFVAALWIFCWLMVIALIGLFVWATVSLHREVQSKAEVRRQLRSIRRLPRDGEIWAFNINLEF